MFKDIDGNGVLLRVTRVGKRYKSLFLWIFLLEVYTPFKQDLFKNVRQNAFDSPPY